MKVPKGHRPKQINPRHKGVIEIVKIWDHLRDSSSTTSKYKIVLRESKDLMNSLNKKVK